MVYESSLETQYDDRRVGSRTGISNPPAMDKPWRVTAAKTEGVTPGLPSKTRKGAHIRSSSIRATTFEQATGADVMGTKFFYALGYFTPENYLVYFTPEQLKVDAKTTFVDHRGVEQANEAIRYRRCSGQIAEGSERPVSRRGQLLPARQAGGALSIFRYSYRRSQRHRSARASPRSRVAFRVFAAWVNHNDSKSLNSLDMLVEQNGAKFIKHHLIDFSAVFGAEAFEPKSPRAGYVPLFDWTSSAKEFFTLGLVRAGLRVRAHHPYVKEIGRLESTVFDPEDLGQQLLQSGIRQRSSG